MKSSAVLAVLLPSLASAAECANYDSAMSSFIRYYESQLWSLRQQMCGDGACGNTQTCTLRAYSSFASVSLYRKDVQYDFPNCWVRNYFSSLLSFSLICPGLCCLQSLVFSFLRIVFG